MKKNKTLLFFAFIFTTFASAQVGIGTQNPQGIFNIDGAKNNATSGAPTAAQQNDDFVVTTAGNVGIGLTAPTNKFEVQSTSVSPYVSLASFYAPNNTTNGNATLFNLGVNATTGNSAQIRFVYTGSDLGTNRVDFGINGYAAPVMTYRKDGFVGIGTTAPSQKLDVVGGGIFRNGNDSGLATRDQILMSYNTSTNFTHSIKTRHNNATAADNAIDFYTWNYGVDSNGTIGTKQVMSLLGNGNVGIGTTVPSGGLTLFGPSVLGLTGSINGISSLTKEIVFGRGGGTKGLAAIAAVDQGAFGGGLAFFTKAPGTDNFPSSAIQTMSLDWTGKVGIGTTTPSEKLEVAGKTKTTNFQMTNGAANNFILTSDASGNGSWKNAQEILVNKISVTPPVGTTANYTIPCDATYDIIQITNTTANFATIITLPSPACAFAGQKVRIISTASSESTIAKTNTNTYGTTLLNTGDVYEYTFSNGKWELTSFPTRNRNFCDAPNSSATTLVDPTTPKTVYYFYNGCWGSPVTLPAGGTLGDILIIDDKASFNVVIKQANTTLAADFTLVTGSYVQFIKTNLGWVKQF